MLEPIVKKNDNLAKWLIGVFSVVVFIVVTLLSKFKINADLGFDVHIFAAFNAIVNSITALLLIAALLAVKSGKYILHKRLMFTCLILSLLFLVSYIAHHLLSGEAKFGDANHDGILSADELAKVGGLRLFYIILLVTHIFLASIILPFILFTTYRALVAEFPAHKKIAKITWPLWFYVAITGPLVYFLIHSYYR
jgi:putative membrane protein